MTLIISTDGLGTQEQRDDFETAVLDALGEICPGTTFDVSDAGVVSVGTRPSKEEYCAHPAGCNLLQCVLDDEQPHALTLRLGTPSYYNSSTLQPRTIYWGDAGSDASILAHELVHACHEYLKQYQTEWKLEEGCTVCAENQVRRELGLGERGEYASEVIDCSTLGKYGNCKPLDETDQLELGCEDIGQSGSDHDGSDPVDDPSEGDAPTGDEGAPTDQGGPHDAGGSHPHVACWECACESDVPQSDRWEKLGDSYLPVGVGGVVLPVAVYARQEEGRCIVRLVGHCPLPCAVEGADEATGADGCLAQFDPLVPHDGPVSAVLRSANRMRCGHEGRDDVADTFERVFDTFDDVLLLERVTPFGSYGFMLLAARPGQGVVVTNYAFRSDEPLFVGPVGPVTHKELDAVVRQEIEAQAGHMAAMVEHGGGEPVNDGATTFLTIRTGHHERRAVLHGYAHMGFNATTDELWILPDDLEAWRATQRVISLWRTAMESAPA